MTSHVASTSSPVEDRSKKRSRDSLNEEELPPRRFVCDWEGCTKTFTRPDHLTRHRLNHAPTKIYDCDRCLKQFVRADLLVRHIQRHEKREQEGKPPLGKAKSSKAKKNTNESLMDLSAAVEAAIATDPPPDQPLVDAAQSYGGMLFNLSSIGSVDPPLTGPAALLGGLSDSGSNMSTSPDNHFTLIHNDEKATEAAAATALELSRSLSNIIDTGQSPSAGLVNFMDTDPMRIAMQTIPDAPLNVIQANFGAPLVSALEYNWLFDPAGGIDFDLLQSRPASPTSNTTNSHAEANALYSLLLNRDTAATANTQASTPVGRSGRGSTHSTSRGHASRGSVGLVSDTPTEGYRPHATEDTPAPDRLESYERYMGLSAFAEGDINRPVGDGVATTPGPTEVGTLAVAVETTSDPRIVSESSDPHVVSETSGPQAVPALATRPTASIASALSVLSDTESEDSDAVGTDAASDADASVPSSRPSTLSNPLAESDPSVYISEGTRERIFEYLGPEWAYLRDEPRLSRAYMMQYMQLYWDRVHEIQMSAVHRATFVPQKSAPPLVLAMLLLGCFFYPEPEAHRLAVKIHTYFRGKVFCSPDFRPRAEIWMLQTILMIIIFGKLCSTRAHHEMAHVFWSAVVTLGRRSGLFSHRTYELPTSLQGNLEAHWAAWIREEVSKRIAFIAFAIDVEHAAFFRHTPSLSAFQVQLLLPADDSAWLARTPTEWARAHGAANPPIPFLSALKASLMPDLPQPELNSLSRLVILHGILSVAQDLQWRDHVVGLSQPVEGRAASWRDMIAAAYNAWKSHLDETLVHASPATSQILRASISLYAVAHITLSIDIHELQIFVGYETVLGLTVTSKLLESTQTRIRQWARSKDGRAATWHAAHFLRSSLEHYFHNVGDLAASLHHRWAVYISCLVMYCYGVAIEGLPSGDRVERGGDEAESSGVMTAQHVSHPSQNEMPGVPRTSQTEAVDVQPPSQAETIGLHHTAQSSDVAVDGITTENAPLQSVPAHPTVDPAPGSSLASRPSTGTPDRHMGRNKDVLAQAMEYLESMCTATPDELVHVKNKNHILALCEVIYSYVKVSRWEIAFEGASLLRDLVRRHHGKH